MVDNGNSFLVIRKETSQRRTIDSLAQLKYDENRFTFVIVCDGNIVAAMTDLLPYTMWKLPRSNR
jgi:hypothetical protein